MNKKQLKVEEQKIKRTIVASRIGYIVIGIAVIVLATIAYWLNQPSNVLEIKNQPIPIRTIRPEGHPAGVVILRYDYCKNIAVEGKIRTSFVSDSAELFLPLADDKTEKACKDEVEVPYIIPPQITAGKYKLHFRATYQLNPIKTVVQEWDSQSFDVGK